MRVKLLTSISGDISGGYGEVVDIDAATAGRLIASGQAEALEGVAAPADKPAKGKGKGAGAGK